MVFDSLTLRDFLSSYPYPAFLLSTKPSPVAAAGYGFSLEPIFTNAPFRHLFNRAVNLSDPSVSNPFVDALGSVDAAKKFSMWLMNSGGQEDIDPCTLVLDFLPSSDPPENVPVTLRLVKTQCGECWAITSIPLSLLPQASASATPPIANSRGIKRPASEGLFLSDMPSPAQFLTSSTVTPSSSFAPAPYEQSSFSLPEVTPNLEPTSSMQEEIRRMMDKFPWETTVLGPRELWPDSMKTISTSFLNQSFQSTDLVVN